MEKKWTSEQEKAIDARGRSLIVSASAGSGKTAVLTERIFSMITDPADPVDVDRLLVVTFTNAAAAEMRQRLLDRIEKALEDPDSGYSDEERASLLRQSALVHSAQISTIDSFCKKVVSEHFNEIDIDPSFRIADENELKLMKADVMAQLLEDKYAEGSVEFRSFVSKVAGGKDDHNVEEIIEQLYRASEASRDQ